MRRSIVALVVAVALLAPADWAAAQRGGRGAGRPHQRPEEKSPLPPAATDAGAFGFTLPDALDAIDRGQGREALAFFERAVAEAEARGDPLGAGRAHAAVTFTATRLGMLQKAIRSGTRARDLLKDATSRELISITASVYNHLGGAYRAAGDLAQARRCYEEGLGFARANTARGEASRQAGYLSNGLAHVAYVQGDWAAALASASEAAQIFEHLLAGPGRRVSSDRLRAGLHRNAAMNFLMLARIHIAMRRLDEAQAALKGARAQATLIGVAELDVEILGVSGSLALRRNDFREALDLYQQAVVLATRMQRTATLIQVHQGVARSAAGLGHLDESLVASESAIALVEEVRGEADPLSSSLLLVPGGGQDGRLEVRELFGMDLVARLVVLSACETGLGKLSRGDEL